jgi:hypothetical protein
MASCGGDTDDGADGANASEGSAATTAAGGGDSPAATSSDAPAGPSSACPLSVEQVSEALGVSMEKEADVCMFSGPSQSLIYVPLPSLACSDAVVRDPTFEMEPYEGLGVTAYTSTVGTELLVCTDPPFSMTVDITPSLDDLVDDATAASAAAVTSEREAAEELARLLLGE